MAAYILLTITLLLAIGGSFAEKIYKDANGKIVQTPFGLPRLTRIGYVLLVLMTVSFGFSLWQTHETRKKASDDRELARKTQGTLDQTRTDLQNLQQLDLKQFEGIATGLKQTATDVTGQLQATGKSLQGAVKHSSTTLDHNIRGSTTPIEGFALSLSFFGSPAAPAAIWNVAHQSRTSHNPPPDERTIAGSRDLALLSTITCAAPVPLELVLTIPLASQPRLVLVGVFFRDASSHCSSHTSLQALEEDSPMADSSYWQTYEFGKPNDPVYTNGRFDVAQLKDIAAHYRLTPSIFNPHADASIQVSASNEKDFAIAKLYVQKNLPLAMGVVILPFMDRGAVDLKDLGAEQAYLLASSETGDAPSTKFFYEAAPMRKAWSSPFWRTAPGGNHQSNNSNVVRLPNPYRALR